MTETSARNRSSVAANQSRSAVAAGQSKGSMIAEQGGDGIAVGKNIEVGVAAGQSRDAVAAGQSEDFDDMRAERWYLCTLF